MRDILGEYGDSNSKSILAVVPSVRKRVHPYTVAGRGRRQSEWVSYLYVKLMSKFMQLRAAGFGFSPALIGHMARTVMIDTPLHNSNFIDLFVDKPVVDKIKTRWAQQFMVYSLFKLVHI